MMKIWDTLAWVDEQHPLELIAGDLGALEGARLLLLVERIDGGEAEFEVDYPGETEPQLGEVPERAQLYIKHAVRDLREFSVRVSTRVGGWFRARLAAVRGQLAPHSCLICRKAIALCISAACAVLGVPSADLGFSAAVQGVSGELAHLFGSGPLADFAAEIAPNLPEVLKSALSWLDALSDITDALYRRVCEQIGACP